MNDNNFYSGENNFQADSFSYAYRAASNGLNNMYIGQILMIISAVLCVIPIISIIGLILVIIGYVMNIRGINAAAKVDDGYDKALSMIIIGIILAVIQIFLAKGGFMYLLMNTAEDVLNYVSMYFILNTSSRMLSNIGRNDLAQMGRQVWKIIEFSIIAALICGIIAVAAVTAGSHFFAALTLIAGLAGLLINIYSVIKYVSFLKKTSVAFIL